MRGHLFCLSEGEWTRIEPRSPKRIRMAFARESRSGGQAIEFLRTGLNIAHRQTGGISPMSLSSFRRSGSGPSGATRAQSYPPVARHSQRDFAVRFVTILVRRLVCSGQGGAAGDRARSRARVRSRIRSMPQEPVGLKGGDQGAGGEGRRPPCIPPRRASAGCDPRAMVLTARGDRIVRACPAGAMDRRACGRTCPPDRGPRSPLQTVAACRAALRRATRARIASTSVTGVAAKSCRV